MSVHLRSGCVRGVLSRVDEERFTNTLPVAVVAKKRDEFQPCSKMVARTIIVADAKVARGQVEVKRRKEPSSPAGYLPLRGLFFGYCLTGIERPQVPSQLLARIMLNVCEGMGEEAEGERIVRCLYLRP